MKVAIVHDYLNQAGGAERVVAAMHRAFPDAPIFTTLFDPDVVGEPLASADVRPSWMQRLPAWRRHFRAYLPLYPFAVRDFDLRGFDVVLSSSSAWAKGARVPPHAVHVCYCHTPMRWAWQLDGYLRHSGMSAGARAGAHLLRPLLQAWDRATVRGVDRFVANSTAVARRIACLYGRDADVLHPPVDVARFRPDRAPGDFFLIVSRLNAYKRVDLAVSACTTLALPLVVVGDGPERDALTRRAGPTVRFLGALPDERVAELFESCRAFILPGEEDFGITPLEANAAGRPVVAFGRGGVLDTIRDGDTGLLFREPTAESLGDALRAVQARDWSAAALRANAERFAEPRFTEALHRLVADALDARHRTGGLVHPAAPPAAPQP